LVHTLGIVCVLIT